MRDINLNNYGQLTAQERLNLTISALARGDIKEADRLYDTCPKYDYNMTDKEYICRLAVMPIIKKLFFENCVYYYNTLAKIDSEIFLLKAKKPTSLNEEIINRFRNHIGKLKALHLGFMEFCDQIGINAKEVLQTMGIEWYCFDIQQYLDSDVESAPKDIERFKAIFLEYWPF